MDKSTHEIRLAHWKKIVSQCQARPKDQTAKAWLAENDISDKQYYYWLRQIRREAYEEMKEKSLPAASASNEPVFAEIPLSSGVFSKPGTAEFYADAVLRYGTATIALSNSASSELIEKIMEAVNHAC